MSGLLSHVGALLAAEMWSAAAPHVLHAARHVQARSEGLRLRRALAAFPDHLMSDAAWAEALLWVAYRAADFSLMDRVLDCAPPEHFRAFRAYRAFVRGDWRGALPSARAAWGAGDTPVVAGRALAGSLAALKREGWQGAFVDALGACSGRDSGLLRLDWAYALTRAGQEGAARTLLARAVLDLRRDPWALTLAQANLGIACLRVDDFQGAAEAFRTALASAQGSDGRAHLSTALRGLGGLAARLGQIARAVHVYETAVLKAETAVDEVEALRSLAGLMRLQGRWDASLTALHRAAGRLDLPVGEQHPLHVDLAVSQVCAGDEEGAAASLRLARPAGPRDEWRVGAVRAELHRRRPGVTARDAVAPLRDLPIERGWSALEGPVFPELFAALGVVSALPLWTARVSANGPVRLTMSGLPITLRPGKAEAALLAYLIWHGGAVSVERALEALTLAGGTPRARQQSLSVAVRELRRALDWPGSVTSSGGILALSKDVQWGELILPPLERTDDFCEGRADPWVVEWRSQRQALQFPVIV